MVQGSGGGLSDLDFGSDVELQNLVVGLSRRKVLVALAALLGLALAVSVLQYIAFHQNGNGITT